MSDQNTDNHEEVLQFESFAPYSQALEKKNWAVVRRQIFLVIVLEHAVL